MPGPGPKLASSSRGFVRNEGATNSGASPGRKKSATPYGVVPQCTFEPLLAALQKEGAADTSPTQAACRRLYTVFKDILSNYGSTSKAGMVLSYMLDFADTAVTPAAPGHTDAGQLQRTLITQEFKASTVAPGRSLHAILNDLAVAPEYVNTLAQQMMKDERERRELFAALKPGQRAMASAEPGQSLLSVLAPVHGSESRRPKAQFVSWLFGRSCLPPSSCGQTVQGQSDLSEAAAFLAAAAAGGRSQRPSSLRAAAFIPPPVDKLVGKVRQQQQVSVRKGCRVQPLHSATNCLFLGSGAKKGHQSGGCGGGWRDGNKEPAAVGAGHGLELPGNEIPVTCPAAIPSRLLHASRHSMICGRDIDLLTGRENSKGRGTAWNAGNDGNRRRNSDGWIGPPSCWTGGPRGRPDHLLGWKGFVGQNASLGGSFSPSPASRKPETASTEPSLGAPRGHARAEASVFREAGDLPSRAEASVFQTFQAFGDLSDVLHRPFTRFQNKAQVHFDAVRCLIAVESEPPVIVSGGDGGKIAVWTIDRDPVTGALDNFNLSLVLHSSGASSQLAHSHTSSLLIGNKFDPYGEGTQANAHEGAVNCLAEDGPYMFSASQDHTIQVWEKDRAYRNVRALVTEKPIIGMLVSRCAPGVKEGTNALVSWSLSEIRVNDLRTLEFMVRVKLQSPMDSRVANGNVAFHRKAAFIVYNRYDVASNTIDVGKKTNFFSHQAVQVKPMAITCITCLAGFLFVAYTNGIIEKVNIDTKTGVASDKVCDMKGHTRDITCFAHQIRSVWSRAIIFLISASLDETIRIWNAHTGECVNIIEEASIVVSLSVARNLLFCGLKKGGFHVWYPNNDDDFESLEKTVDAEHEQEKLALEEQLRQSQKERRSAAKAQRHRGESLPASLPL